ncbi:integrase, catalytic region, zinc finger, CCHC-type containing protein [Tanacetum coccineum]
MSPGFTVYLKMEVKNEDLKAQIQDKVFVITSLKNDLRKLKGKEIVDIAAQTPSAHTIVLGMFKLDVEPLAPRLLQNREMHIAYLKYTQEQADILRGIVEQAKEKQPLDKELDFAVSLLAIKDDRISQTPSRNMKNKVEAQPRKVNKKNRVVEPICDDNVKHSKLNANSDLNCAICKKSLFDDVHDKCYPDCSLVSGLWMFETHDRESLSAHELSRNDDFSRVYLRSRGLGIVLSIGQFCDGDLEVTFWKNTCFIRNLEGVYLLSGSRDTNLYTISLDDMVKTFPICLLSKASKTKSWLWHRRLSHLNFGTINKLAKDGLAQDLNFKKIICVLHVS